jgi:hypothetical protein
MNAMLSLGLSGVFQVRSRAFMDVAGELPCLERSTLTNSTASGNQRHFCSFQVRLYFRSRMHTHRTIMKALSSDAEKRKVSSIIMVLPSLSEGATPSCSHNCVHSSRKSCIIFKKMTGQLRSLKGITTQTYLRLQGAKKAIF